MTNLRMRLDIWKKRRELEAIAWNQARSLQPSDQETKRERLLASARSGALNLTQLDLVLRTSTQFGLSASELGELRLLDSELRAARDARHASQIISCRRCGGDGGVDQCCEHCGGTGVEPVAT